MNMLENIVHRKCTVIEIQHMKFQESSVSKAILSTVYSLQSTVCMVLIDSLINASTQIVHCALYVFYEANKDDY